MAVVDMVHDSRSWRPDPSRRSVVAAVLRRLFPFVIEATVVPTALYYVALSLVGQWWAILVAASWTFACVARRVVLRRPVPGLLMLATLGISIRVLIYLLNENTFVYFVQPIIRTVATALFFGGSVLFGRPLVRRFAADFCQFDAEVGARPAITSLFRRLTILWTVVQTAIAAINLTLLLTVPVPVFVGAASATASLLMCGGVVATVSDAVRTTRGDGLRTAVARGGHIHAYV